MRYSKAPPFAKTGELFDLGVSQQSYWVSRTSVDGRKVTSDKPEDAPDKNESMDQFAKKIEFQKKRQSRMMRLQAGRLSMLPPELRSKERFDYLTSDHRN